MSHVLSMTTGYYIQGPFTFNTSLAVLTSGVINGKTYQKPLAEQIIDMAKSDHV